MQELAQLTWVFSRSFSMPCASFWMLDGPGGTGCKFLHSEVNILIQNIIAQDQDGQTTTTTYILGNFNS